MRAETGLTMSNASLDRLQREVAQLFQIMNTFKRELASIRGPGEPDHFSTMAEQLDAIVGATENATNTILQSVEEIAALVDERREALTTLGSGAWIEQLDQRARAIFEACTFQDITGQRVTKVVNSLKFMDERLDALADIYGREALAAAAKSLKRDQGDRTEGEVLDGPQLQGKGASQADIDKMFD